MLKVWQPWPRQKGLRKISVRDFGPAMAQKASGGTTVAGTLILSEMAGIKIFATGGIGGVHRDAPFDISTDLGQLAKSKVIVVCAGAKAILDLPATLEQLETLGVPVIGYQTDEFPAFYSRQSGLAVSARADSPEETAAIAKAHWQMGGGGLLVTVPVPEADAIPAAEVEVEIQQALAEAAGTAHPRPGGHAVPAQPGERTLRREELESQSGPAEEQCQDGGSDCAVFVSGEGDEGGLIVG